MSSGLGKSTPAKCNFCCKLVGVVDESIRRANPLNLEGHNAQEDFDTVLGREPAAAAFINPSLEARPLVTPPTYDSSQ